jgi:hypothetical protein
VGIGASLSTTLARYLSDYCGRGIAFTTLAGIAIAGAALICLLMSETGPEREGDGTPDNANAAPGVSAPAPR